MIQPRFRLLMSFLRELSSWGVDLLDPTTITKIPQRQRQMLLIKYSELDLENLHWQQNDETIPVKGLFDSLSSK